ncbi:MAG: radical SAM protein [Candidatus Bathyarchaeia archaeon]
MELPLLGLFDPWHGKLCTCPVKYSLAPYTGCSHDCLYCYITGYIQNPFHARPKMNLLNRLDKELRKADRSEPVSIANSSDPYTPPEDCLGLTRKVLEILFERGFKVLLTTKSNLVVRDLDVIRRGRCAVSLTITTLDDGSARLIEPGAPPPSLRLKALGEIASNGIPCSIRFDPIIPTVNDELELVEELVSKAAEVGVSHITASTYKAKPDNFKRLTSALTDSQKIKLTQLYLRKGQRIGGSIYLPWDLRFKLLARVRDAAARYRVTFSTCREGFPQLSDAGSCDGTHLIPSG